MRHQLTKKDIALMEAELEERRIHLRPKLLDAVKEARSFGDLSENFEYKAAKQEKNHNERRIRYLEQMIRSAILVSETSHDGGVSLYDKVTVYIEEEDATEYWQIVTTVRQNALQGLISNESPVGRALLGHHVGDRILITVDASYSYYITIREITPQQDDGTAALTKF